MTDKDALIEELRAQIRDLTLRNAGLRASLAVEREQTTDPTIVDRIVTALRDLHENGHTIGWSIVTACRRHRGSLRPAPEHVTDEGLAERLEALASDTERLESPRIVKAGEGCYVVMR